MPEIIDNYNIYLYSGRNDNDLEHDSKNYLPFTNDYSNVMQFDTKEDRDKYFDAIPHYIVVQTDEYKAYLDGGTIKIAFGAGLRIDCGFENIRYMRIDSAWGIQEPPPGVAPYGYIVSAKYYFVNSYEIISSYNGVTIVVFNIEYDYWMNNQFDFEFKDTNVERMHVDRWYNDNKYVKYNRPSNDGVLSNLDKEVIEGESTLYDEIVIYDCDIKNGHASAQDIYEKTIKVIWCVVTLTNDRGESEPTAISHRIFPVKIDGFNYEFSGDNYLDYYYTNAIPAIIKPTQTKDNWVYYPPLQALNSGELIKACMRSDNDNVKISNIQFFGKIPVQIARSLTNVEGTNKINIGNHVLALTQATISEAPYPDYTSAVLMSYANLMDSRIPLSKNVNIEVTTTLIKPQNGATHKDLYEPMMFVSPVRTHVVQTKDNRIITEIPSVVYLDMVNSTYKFYIKLAVSFSATYSHYYVKEITNLVKSLNRAQLMKVGFSFVLPSYLGDFASDNWIDYCTTQRDSDRYMMYANILTGTISEMGSTAVSAGIGYRSNAERAIASQNESNFDVSMANFYGKSLSYNSPEARQFYLNRNRYIDRPNSAMYKNMGKSAMMMSGIGGIASMTSNAISQYTHQKAKENAIANTASPAALNGDIIGSIYNDELSIQVNSYKCDDESYAYYDNLYMKFGYYIGSPIIPNIKSRKFFNYIKTNGAVLIGNVNNLILSALASIFDAGVTIWHMDNCVTYTTVNDEEKVDELHIFDYTYENIERSLI